MLARADRALVRRARRRAETAARRLAERRPRRRRPGRRERRVRHRQDAAGVAPGCRVHAEGGVVLGGRADEENVWPYQAIAETLCGTTPPIAAAWSRMPASARGGACAARWCPSSERRPCPRLGVAHERDRNRRHLFEAVVRLLLHAARGNGLLSSWRTCIGLMPRRRCCSVTSSAEARRACSWSRRSTIDGEPSSDCWPSFGTTASWTPFASGLRPAEVAELVAAHAGVSRRPMTSRSGGCARRPAATRSSSRSAAQLALDRGTCRRRSSSSSAGAWTGCAPRARH
jgi:hypothetical protein